MTITSDIQKAANLLTKGAVVAIPTETVYGLAGNIFNEKAIRTIFDLKKRPLYNPLIVHLKSYSDLEQVAVAIPDKARALAEAFWPGPLTLVLKKQPNISDLITAGKDTVAVRVPNHPVALALLNSLDFPLAAPSANPFGSISPTTASHVSNYFDTADLFVLDGGDCARGIESTIVGFEGDEPILYRAGATNISAIEAVVGPLKVFTKDDIAPVAPGMLSKHYAPSTPTFFTTNISESLENYCNKRIGLLSFCQTYNHPAIVFQNQLSKNQNLEEAASRLYALLHELDAQDIEVLLVEKVPHEGIGIAINDKLQRASVQ
ncbi:threonylcarbamoyl-AMP synthase [Flavobacterium sp. LM5]|uniref:L-threonylcarbamoyladenylate synthase n=1 Tax=Flavobacterium sp. LM5 TaxID=1938610 RepID=UPI0009938BAB|nr:L-threonylcarbamoyladenylate synthase [Flavobacterium sp. LM5]OOV29441.1 threonylcarbamoyl-AMP synthase [Flavobacterium sp. LM5]